jgi:hypothetical protein
MERAGMSDMWGEAARVAVREWETTEYKVEKGKGEIAECELRIAECGMPNWEQEFLPRMTQMPRMGGRWDRIANCELRNAELGAGVLTADYTDATDRRELRIIR